jgi:hypothetical protein
MSRKHRVHLEKRHEKPQAVLLGFLISCALLMLVVYLLTMPLR